MRRISTLKILIVLLGLTLAGCAGPKRTPPLSPTLPPPTPPRSGDVLLLGIGLQENALSCEISASGPALVIDGSGGGRLIRLDRADQPVVCRRSGARVAWSAGGQSGDAAAILLQPLDPDHRLSHGDREYRGDLLVIPTPGSTGLTLINNIDLESYLKGVVPWEIGRHGQERLAALEAQAVAARTYTISHLGARKSRGFDLFASVMDQVYKGAADEDTLCNRAVDTTAGLVLRHQDEEIEAYYSACCGGVSSNIEEVWARGPRPYLNSRPDGPGPGGRAYCAESRYFDWREVWTAGQLEAIIAESLPAYLEYITQPSRIAWGGTVFEPRTGNSDINRPGRLRGLEIRERTTSGRVAVLAVSTDAGVYRVRGDRVRWVLQPAGGNPAILRSARFEVELVRDGDRLVEVAARGRGFGHGIGLCQTGALAMASAGKSFKEILAQYYPGTRLEKVGGVR
jgi:stage II sporulation protein D